MNYWTLWLGWLQQNCKEPRTSWFCMILLERMKSFRGYSCSNVFEALFSFNVGWNISYLGGLHCMGLTGLMGEINLRDIPNTSSIWLLSWDRESLFWAPLYCIPCLMWKKTCNDYSKRWSSVLAEESLFVVAMGIWRVCCLFWAHSSPLVSFTLKSKGIWISWKWMGVESDLLT